MTKRLYVGDLPDHVTDEILKNLFSTYGTVESVTVMINKITDLPQGFGFVEMSCESEAQEAIQNLNGTQVDGRTIKVHEARPRPVPPRRKSTWRQPFWLADENDMDRLSSVVAWCHSVDHRGSNLD